MTDNQPDSLDHSRMRGLRIPILLKLSAFVTALLILSTLVLGVAAFNVAEGMLHRQINSRLSTTASDRQKLLLAYLQQQHERVALVASRTRFRQLVQSYLQEEIPEEEFLDPSRRILVDALQSTTGFQAIWLADPTGQTITGTDDIYLGRDESETEPFQVARDGRYFGRPFSTGGQWHTYVAAQVVADDDQQLGVVMVLLDVSPLVEFLTDTENLGDSGEVRVGMPVGDKVRYLLPPRHNGSLGERPLDDEPLVAAAMRGKSGFVPTTDYRQTDVLAAYRPVGYLDWGMVVQIDVDEAYAPVSQLRRIWVWIAVPILIVGVLVSYFMARVLTNRILVLKNEATSVASGNLDTSVAALRQINDELGDLEAAFAAMTDSLRGQRRELQDGLEVERKTRAEMESLTTELRSSFDAEQLSRQELQELVHAIQQAVSQLGASASQILLNVSRQSNSTHEQASAVSETSATVTQVTRAAQQAAQLADEVARSAKQAQDVGDLGSKSARDSVAAIDRVGNEFESTAANMQNLAERARAIGEIIDTVTDIADQTNVLALNAAVEAARAGEQGKGFAVVAREVKLLAESAKKSTKQVRDILGEIQAATNKCVLSTELGAQAVGEASDIIKTTAETIESLVQTIGQAARTGSQILASANQQAAALSQISTAMDEISRASADSLTAARETEQSARDLSALGQRLNELSSDQT